MTQARAKCRTDRGLNERTRKFKRKQRLGLQGLSHIPAPTHSTPGAPSHDSHRCPQNQDCQ